MKLLSKYFLVLMILLSTSANSEVKFGIEGGFGFADMRAQQTAQTLANLSGSAVTYTYDEATWMGRVFADFPLADQVNAEIGYFFSGSLDATYTITGSSATESYDAMGVDAAIVFKQDTVYFKAGMHQSELNGSASLNIGGTVYNVSSTISGSGFLVGGGFEVNDTRYGLTYYSDVGGDANSDVTFLYAGVKF